MDFELERFIHAHGAWSYLITFVWTFFEGETFVLLAGFAAAQGLLSAPILFVCAWLGSFAGDQSYFWIGRHFGLRLLARRPAWRGKVDRALDWLTRYDAIFILSYRFIYGVRNFSSFALGISAIAWQRFLTLNLAAALVWAAIFISAGYLCGHAFERVLGQVAHRFSVALLIVFLVLIAGGHVVHKLRSLRRRRAEDAAATRLSNL